MQTIIVLVLTLVALSASFKPTSRVASKAQLVSGVYSCVVVGVKSGALYALAWVLVWPYAPVEGPMGH